MFKQNENKYRIIAKIVDYVLALLILVNPTLSVAIVVQVMVNRGSCYPKLEILVPVALTLIWVILTKISLKLDKKVKADTKSNILKRKKRFTKVDKDGVSIDSNDLPEVIMYLGQIEDYLYEEGGIL